MTRNPQQGRSKTTEGLEGYDRCSAYSSVRCYARARTAFVSSIAVDFGLAKNLTFWLEPSLMIGRVSNGKTDGFDNKMVMTTLGT